MADYRKVLTHIVEIVVTVLLLSSCNVTKYLKDNERLVAKNIIILETDLLKEEKSTLSYQLSTINKQKPNSKFLFSNARLWWYYKAQREIAEDSSRFYLWIRRRLAEPPVIYDKNRMGKTVEMMQFYLNNKGYFNAKVLADTIHKKEKKLWVNYHINTNKPMRIAATTFISQDDSLHSILRGLEEATLLKENKSIDKTLFNKEKNRIVQTLQNQGYAYFYPNYVFFEGDSIGLKSSIQVILAAPSDSTFHKKYRIGKIFIHTNYTPLNRANTMFDTTEVDGYFFVKSADEEKFNLRTSPILNSITFKTSDIYRVEDFETTRRQLLNLNVHKFVRLKFEADPHNDRQLVYNIYLNPSKKMEFGADLELTSITGGESTIGESLGIFGNLNFKNRNAFRGAEMFTLNPVGGVEFAIDQDNRVFNTVDIRLQSELLLPKIKQGWLTGAKTRFSSSFNFISRATLYTYTLWNSTAGFDWQTKRHRHIYNPISLNYLRPVIADNFQSTIDANPFLQSSFEQQLIIGANYSYTHAGPVSRNGNSWRFRGNLEAMGNTLWLLDQFNQAEQLFLFDSIPYSQYLRFDLEGGYTKRFTAKSSVAFRIGTGIGWAYGNASEMPYVKQFYAGGTSGIRAWRIRELGPGNFYDAGLDTLSIIPYQTGDFKLELNAEYRFMLWSLLALEGAFFVDAGNVWTIKADVNRLGSQFTSQFWDQLGIGAGFGFRRDFSYFIFRVDLAYKILTPFDDGTGRWFKTQWYRPVLNLAIGYPF